MDLRTRYAVWRGYSLKKEKSHNFVNRKNLLLTYGTQRPASIA